ncbi:MAG: radical SAM protein, partial [Candidatus Latescibacteria bacterium]|nr:radical SAM protein [Candidatus Latescibacterota bacterium]
MPNALLVYPKNPVTFWSFDEALRLIGKKSAFPPLGLLTIAGMMPDDYSLRVVDVNVHPLTDENLDWADIVITSSMIIHWNSLEEIIAQ